jgi:hypothetical protein
MGSRHGNLFDFEYEEVPVKLEDVFYGDCNQALSCPHCQSSNLHHYGFTDYERSDELIEEIVDCGSVFFTETGERNSVFGRTGAATDAVGSSLKIFSNTTDGRNPSQGSNGIVIKFWCEMCENISILCIAQHKGYSHIYWRAIKAIPKKQKRKNIKPKLRFDILERDKYTCQACGATPQDGVTLEIDHIQPVSKGGTDHPDNLQVLCRKCNAGKGAR